MSEKSIAELESKFYEDLAEMEIRQKRIYKILENAKTQKGIN